VQEIELREPVVERCAIAEDGIAVGVVVTEARLVVGCGFGQPGEWGCYISSGFQIPTIPGWYRDFHSGKCELNAVPNQREIVEAARYLSPSIFKLLIFAHQSSLVGL